MEQGTEQYPSLWRAPEPEPTYEPPQSPIREDRGIFKRLGGGIVALGALLAKLKVLFLLLPKAKILTTAGTMLVSLAAYAWLFGWWFGLGFVLLLFVHEMGHAIQLRREGVKAGWPIFIPLLGAYIGMKEMPKDAGAEARVGLAGPVLGTIGCLVPLALYAITGSDIFRALAFIGFFLNLFNLVPILPLDGGRAMAAVSPAFWGVGFALMVVAAILFPEPDHPHHRPARRPGDLAALQDTQVARDAGLPQGEPRHSPGRGRGLHLARAAARGGHSLHPLRAHVQLKLSFGISSRPISSIDSRSSCSRCWSITRSTPASSSASKRSAT